MHTPNGLLIPDHNKVNEKMVQYILNDLVGFSLPAITGYERGYNQAADVVTQLADGTDINAMWREFQQTLNMFNDDRDRLLSMLTFNVSNPVERVMQPSSSEDFEEATEFGEPKGIRVGVPFYIGYPFKWWDLAARYTWMFLAESDQQQVEAVHASVLEAGNRLYFHQVLKRLFNATNTTATIDGVPYNVYALYNNDGTVPPPYKGTTHLGTHTHYLTTGTAALEPADLTDIETHLYHHGYRLTTGYSLVLLVSRQESLVIRQFTKGAAGPLTGAYDFIPNGNIGGGIRLPEGTVVGAPTMSQPAGAIGTWGPFVVVEDEYVPTGYVVGLASGGEQNIGNPIGLREHENPGLRGLQLVKGRDNDYPLVDSFYRFGFGAGVRHRGAGVVMQVTVAGSYTPPTIYA
jgi:hypothetical protein